MKINLRISEIESERENVIAHMVQKIVNDFMDFIKKMDEMMDEEEEK